MDNEGYDERRGHITNGMLSVVENEGHDGGTCITNGTLSVVDNEGYDERRGGGGTSLMEHSV